MTLARKIPTTMQRDDVRMLARSKPDDLITDRQRQLLKMDSLWTKAQIAARMRISEPQVIKEIKAARVCREIAATRIADAQERLRGVF
jgi:DNA-binding transcriptional regulator LsrR (DeoR family)